MSEFINTRIQALNLIFLPDGFWVGSFSGYPETTQIYITLEDFTDFLASN